MNLAFEFKQKSFICGDYYEFGVYRGASLVRAWKARNRMLQELGDDGGCHFYAFDSFEGLPELTAEDTLAGYDDFHPGDYCASKEVVECTLKEAKMGVQHVTLIAGFYDKSLTDPATHGLLSTSRAAIVHLDCDLCSSAKLCLSFISSRLVDGSVILFDDWFNYRGRPDQGVHRAMREWERQTRFVVSEYFRYSWAGIAFIVNMEPPTQDFQG